MARFSLLILLGLLIGAAASARAQQQEGGTLERITHPDRTLAFEGGNKTFTASSTVSGKQAGVMRPFLFGSGGGTANVAMGDGKFRTRAFTSREGGFQTKEFSSRPATAVTKDFAQTGKTFGTKTMDVKEDRAANKAMTVKEYAPFERAYLGRGKRQDDLDDIYRQKSLNIDQVRQLLNKPGGSTDAPVQRTVAAPVFRAQVSPDVR